MRFSSEAQPITPVVAPDKTFESYFTDELAYVQQQVPLLGKTDPEVRSVLRGWGPGKFDASLLLDGKTSGPRGPSAVESPSMGSVGATQVESPKRGSASAPFATQAQKIPLLPDSVFLN